MITVRIPKEIREYKEKIFLGLTARQLIASILTLGICVPLFLFGRKFINEDLLSWIVIAIGALGGGIGFFKKNGMPFEKYLYVIIKNGFLFPQKTLFKTDNFYRSAQTVVEKEEELDRKKFEKYKLEASYERSFLIEELEAAGKEVDMKEVENNLVTVKTLKRIDKDAGKSESKSNKMKKDVLKVSKAQLVYEQVEQKKKEDPNYFPTKKEGAMLLKYSKECQNRRLKEIQQGKKAVKTKNTEMKKRRNPKSYIPKATQDDLPYIADYEEGLFEVAPNMYSKCYEILDINYLVAKEEEAISIFCKWGEFLNYFSEDMYIALYIDNRIVSLSEQENKIFYKLTGDEYDIHRQEFNKILKKQLVVGNNDIQQSKYVTVTIEADTPYEALLRFHKIDTEVCANLHKIGSDGRVLTTEERLSLLHDKMRKGREGELHLDFETMKMRGISSKDYIAPTSFLFKEKDKFMIEQTYYRCMYVNNLPASLSDEFLNDMMDCKFPIIGSLNIQPVAQDKALRLVKRQLTGMEANKIEAEKKAIRAGYSPDIISHDLKQSLNQAQELLDDMINKNQKMFFVSIMFLISGDTEDELEENTKIVVSKARKYTCQMQCFDNQQREAFKILMPMGIPTKGQVFVDRVLTTESTSIFVPFANQELFQSGGFYYGLNQISRNLILCDRTKMKTPSGFVLGSAGSGKSFACKREMLSVLLADDKTGLLIIDPESEYVDFCRAFGGTVLSLSTNSDCYINPMDMDINYGLEDDDEIDSITIDRKKEMALKKKADYLMSIIQCMVADSDNRSTIMPQQKSIIDRAIRRTYQEYFDHDFDINYVPTLVDLQNELDSEKGTEEGRLIAEAVEYYTKGSMNLFSHKSNLNYSHRFVVFNIRDLGNELKQISLLIVLDFIWNRMIANCQKEIRTYCYVDEIHVLFRNPFSESYLQQLYKRGRKYGLVITGITQDVEDILKSNMARTMIHNSDFILMLNQNGDNLALLADMLNISDAQKVYVSRSDAGSGLLFAESTIVPFVDQFPDTSYLYTLMSTKFGEETDSSIEEFIKELQLKQEKMEEEQQDSDFLGEYEESIV